MQTLRLSVAIMTLTAAMLADVLAAPPSHTDVRLGEQALAFSSGFIRDHVPVDGHVIKTAFNREILGQKDTLYLRLTNLGDVEVGSLFTVYRRIHKVFHPVSQRYLGNLYAILGVARVVRLDGDMATAKVERAYGSIYPGDLLMNFELPTPDSADPADLLPEQPGMVVDIQTPRTLVGQGNIIYVDWGRQDGLKAGDRLQVMRRRAGFPTEPIGELRVLSVEDTSASTLIVRSVTPVAIGDLVVGLGPAPAMVSTSPSNAVTIASKPTASRDALKRSLAADIAKGDVSVTETGNTLMISLNDLVDQLEYEPGEAQIKPTGLRILKQIADYLKSQPSQQIVVEGHTDSMPIGPSLLKRYPTNKELSDARATLIVRYFTEQGLGQHTMSSIGLAHHRPVATNATEEGRRKNRRIEIVVIPTEPANPAPPRAKEPAKEASAPNTPAPPAPVEDPWRVNLPKPLPAAPPPAEIVGQGEPLPFGMEPPTSGGERAADREHHQAATDPGPAPIH